MKKSVLKELAEMVQQSVHLVCFHCKNEGTITPRYNILDKVAKWFCFECGTPYTVKTIKEMIDQQPKSEKMCCEIVIDKYEVKQPSIFGLESFRYMRLHWVKNWAEKGVVLQSVDFYNN